MIFFQVLIHSPLEYPEVSARGFSVYLMQEAFVAVTAQTTERLFSYL
jgi:hypothetical protein